MLNGHFDFGNGFHGPVYLNPHQLFRYPSTIWRFAQDLLDVLPPSVVEETEIVTGPVTGGALLAHTMAGLLDSRRPITRPPTLFAPFTLDANCGHTLDALLCASRLPGRRRWSWTTSATPGRRRRAAPSWCARQAARVIATAEIYDRMEAIVDAGVPNFALAEYKAPDNYPAERARCAGRACPSRRSERWPDDDVQDSDRGGDGSMTCRCS